MQIKVAKVLLCLSASGGTETLVVLDLPPLGVVTSRFLPGVILGKSKERLGLLSLGRLDDGGNELLQESGMVKQRGPKVMNKVDNEALDMRTIVILISHDH